MTIIMTTALITVTRLMAKIMTSKIMVPMILSTRRRMTQLQKRMRVLRRRVMKSRKHYKLPCLHPCWGWPLHHSPPPKDRHAHPARRLRMCPWKKRAVKRNAKKSRSGRRKRRVRNRIIVRCGKACKKKNFPMEKLCYCYCGRQSSREGANFYLKFHVIVIRRD